MSNDLPSPHPSEEEQLRTDSALARAASVQSVPLSSIHPETLRDLFERRAANPKFCVSSLSGPQPTVLFEAPASISDSNCSASDIAFLPWGSACTFGGIFSIHANSRVGELSRVFIPSHSPLFRNFADGRFLAVLARHQRPVLAYAVDFSRPAKTFARFLQHWETARNHVPLVLDDDAATWEAAIQMGDIESQRDHLSAVWVAYYSRCVARYLKRFDTPIADLIRGDLSDSQQTKVAGMQIRLPSSLSTHFDTPQSRALQFVRALRHYPIDLNAVFHCLQEWSSEPSFVNEYIELLNHATTAGHPIVVGALEQFMRSSQLTRCGTRVPWIDSISRSLRYLDLDVTELSRKKAVDWYWNELIYAPFYLNLGHIAHGYTAPIWRGRLWAGFSTFAVEGDAQQVLASASTLLEEACAGKKWTIPHGARVQLEIGPFKHIDMFEVSDEVYCVLGTADEYVWIVRVIPTKQSMQMQLHATDSDLPAETQDSIIAGVSLLLAAIIRDFWVVEERESAFLGRQVHKPRTGSKPADADIRTVYLPRVRYINRPDIERCATELAHHERRAHWVSAHLRLAEHASEQQYLLAEHYGFHIPSGYTFVRQHERGGKKREVIYRSRSALNLLYTLSTDQLAGSRPEWFKFERDVYSLMSALGFRVQHVAASKSGDKGVDIYATKGSDFDLVNWVIQCKCYAPTHKVNPSKIREMKGVLSDYPHGTRGMIVTTSSFTSGALEEAKAAEIRLVDGAEFVGLVESAR